MVESTRNTSLGKSRPASVSGSWLNSKPPRPSTLLTQPPRRGSVQLALPSKVHIRPHPIVVHRTCAAICSVSVPVHTLIPRECMPRTAPSAELRTIDRCMRRSTLSDPFYIGFPVGFTVSGPVLVRVPRRGIPLCVYAVCHLHRRQSLACPSRCWRHPLRQPLGQSSPLTKHQFGFDRSIRSAPSCRRPSTEPPHPDTLSRSVQAWDRIAPSMPDQPATPPIYPRGLAQVPSLWLQSLLDPRSSGGRRAQQRTH